MEFILKIFLPFCAFTSLVLLMAGREPNDLAAQVHFRCSILGWRRSREGRCPINGHQ